jgi:hypothetical protein
MILKNSIKNIKDLRTIDVDCEEIHLTTAFSKKNILKILEKCKRLKSVSVSRSTKERLSKGSKQVLTKNKIKLFIKKEQGRPLEINISKLNKIISLYKDHSYRELEEKLKVPKSTIHYLIKYSKRKKIKDGKKIIYLK